MGVRAWAAIGLLCLAIASCTTLSSRHGIATHPESAPTAQQARSAVIDYIRSYPESFEGKPDADKLAVLPLADNGDDTFTFGGIRINPGKCWYDITLGGGAGMIVYNGAILQKDGKWIASPLDVTRFEPHP